MPTWKKLLGLSACKKSTSALTSFLRYCQDIANLLFWEIWECLTNPIKNQSINLYAYGNLNDHLHAKNKLHH